MKENILIIGGGAAGMEAATQLKKLGLNPIIVEKSEKLGGHIAQWDRLFPAFHPAKDVVEQMLNNVKDVDARLNTEVTDIQRDNNGFHAVLSNKETIDAKAVILATGFDLFKAESLGSSRPLPELFDAANIKFDFTPRTLEPLMQVVWDELGKQ